MLKFLWIQLKVSKIYFSAMLVTCYLYQLSFESIWNQWYIRSEKFQIWCSETGLSNIRDNFLEVLSLAIIADVLINATKACKVFWALQWKVQ